VQYRASCVSHLSYVLSRQKYDRPSCSNYQYSSVVYISLLGIMLQLRQVVILFFITSPHILSLAQQDYNFGMSQLKELQHQHDEQWKGEVVISTVWLEYFNFNILLFNVQLDSFVENKWLAGKTVSEMTYISPPRIERQSAHQRN